MAEMPEAICCSMMVHCSSMSASVCAPRTATSMPRSLAAASQPSLTLPQYSEFNVFRTTAILILPSSFFPQPANRHSTMVIARAIAMILFIFDTPFRFPPYSAICNYYSFQSINCKFSIVSLHKKVKKKSAVFCNLCAMHKIRTQKMVLSTMDCFFAIVHKTHGTSAIEFV